MDKKRHINLSMLKELSSNNNSFLADILKLFLRNTPDEITAIKDAIEKKEWQTVRQVAHRLKSSCGALGFTSGQSLLGTLEKLATESEDQKHAKKILEEVEEKCEIAYVEADEELNLLPA